MSRKIKSNRCPHCNEVSMAPGKFKIPSFTVVKGNPNSPADTDELQCNCCGAISTKKEIRDYNS